MKKKRTFRFLAVFFVVFFVFTASVFADDAAVITGKVGAPGNEDVDGAIVKLLGDSDQLIEETQVNSSGDYEFENVPYGDYQMYASLEGFEDSNTHKVKVNRPVVNVNLQLRPGDSDPDDDSDDPCKKYKKLLKDVKEAIEKLRGLHHKAADEILKGRKHSEFAIELLNNNKPIKARKEFSIAAVLIVKAERRLRFSEIVIMRLSKEITIIINNSETANLCPETVELLKKALVVLKKLGEKDKALLMKALKIEKELKENYPQARKAFFNARTKDLDDLDREIKKLFKTGEKLEKMIAKLMKRSNKDLKKFDKLIEEIKKDIDDEKFDEAFLKYKKGILMDQHFRNIIRREKSLFSRLRRAILQLMDYREFIIKAEINYKFPDNKLKILVKTSKKLEKEFENYVKRFKKLHKEFFKLTKALEDKLEDFIKELTLNLKDLNRGVRGLVEEFGKVMERAKDFADDNIEDLFIVVGAAHEQLRDSERIINENERIIVDRGNDALGVNILRRAVDLKKLTPVQKQKIKDDASAYNDIVNANNNIQNEKPNLESALTSLIQETDKIEQGFELDTEAFKIFQKTLKPIKKTFDILKIFRELKPFLSDLPQDLQREVKETVEISFALTRINFHLAGALKGFHFTLVKIQILYKTTGTRLDINIHRADNINDAVDSL